MRKVYLLLVITAALVFNACKKSTEVLDPATVSQYSPFIVGKYISYNLDSTVFINFGARDTVKKYQIKLVVDAAITDNLGRPAYRIIRYIRNIGATAWVPDNTFMAVPTDFAMEFVENNMRFLKLKGPVREAYTWKGNSYIDTYSLNSNVKYLDDWNYIYDSVNVRKTVGTFTLDSTVHVAQRDEIIGNPNDPNSYSERNFSAEDYARGLGLVYRNFLHIEYQPPRPGVAAYRVGYGIKMTMIDHN
jgi:hypothetical protein